MYDNGALVGTYGAISDPSNPSPADILRRVIISLSLASDPELSSIWPCYTGTEPPTPDSLITTYDVVGRDNGRIMQDGSRAQLYGVQVRVRSITHIAGYAKCREIAVALDTQVYDTIVQIASVNFIVHSVSRSSDVMALGKDVSSSKRSIFTLNVLIHTKQLQP